MDPAVAQMHAVRPEARDVNELQQGHRATDDQVEHPTLM